MTIVACDQRFWFHVHVCVCGFILFDGTLQDVKIVDDLGKRQVVKEKNALTGLSCEMLSIVA